MAVYTRNGQIYTEPNFITLADIDENPNMPQWARNQCHEMYQRHRLTLSLFLGNMELCYRRGVQEGQETTND